MCRLISKVDESVKVSKVGVMYEVGNRMLILCERVVTGPIPERGHNGSESVGIEDRCAVSGETTSVPATGPIPERGISEASVVATSVGIGRFSGEATQELRSENTCARAQGTAYLFRSENEDRCAIHYVRSACSRAHVVAGTEVAHSVNTPVPEGSIMSKSEKLKKGVCIN